MMPAHRRIIVVIGWPRSGTSMMLQMLRAGGVPVVPGSGTELIEFDPICLPINLQAFSIPPDLAFWASCRGKALKIIEPDIIGCWPPARENLVFIHMQRDPAQQGASMVKYHNHFIGGIILNVTKNLIETIERSRERIQDQLLERYDCLVINESFEEILRDPFSAAKRLLENGLAKGSPETIASVVYERDGRCFDGFLEYRLLEAAYA